MRILVCVKEVPDTEEVKIDPIKNTIIRSGVPKILNPYDAYALEKALEIKDILKDTKIYVISMGPKQVDEMLRSCLATGADKAYLLTDRKFGGSDTLATSYILSEAIKYIQEKETKFDLIFCGKQAIDGETAQVGPEIASKLDLPQVTYALDIKLMGDKAHVTKEIDEGNLIIETDLPALITFTKTKDLRFPTMKNKMKSLKEEIEVLSLKEIININKDIIGLDGSPTRVSRMYAPKKQKESIIFNMQNDKDAINKLVNLLKAENKIK
ncbi:electron transfer flavoprotein subunit beta/FixA family protein [Oceanivirga salmonicida]|uniref:electron transfer flavoprotein subunit beta/FixA family protein n=1 Tax=Oceanivirga salmonicida TaxID=1769291 RepID=UPI0012E3231F|nr:electron transfer flavoprotein subunit beta/FixA family protein [Oceanivirga salmonicida]